MRPADAPTEHVVLSLGKFSQRYVPTATPVTPAVPISTSWNLAANSLGTFPARCGE